METPSTYFTRRAREERANAVDADSAEARSAHLNLAVRMVNAATGPAMWSAWYDNNPMESAPDRMMTNLANPLRQAFAVPMDNEFQQLLDAIDFPATQN